MNNKFTIIRRIFALFLVLPTGYVFYKSHLPNPVYTKFDEVLRYFFPALIALAYIVDSWGRTEDKTKNIVRSALILSAALVYGFVMGQGKKIDDNQIMGVILVGLFISLLSCIAFYCGSFQHRETFENDSLLKKAYYFSIGCFIYSFLQIPLWSLFTGHFPPRAFNFTGAVIATIGVIFGLLGPAAPWFITYFRALAEMRRRGKSPEGRS